MPALIQEKIQNLDVDILKAAKEENFATMSQKVNTQKSLEAILRKRDNAETELKYFRNQNLFEDDLFVAAQNGADTETITAIENRKLTKQQYQELSNKYGVNSDVVEYDAEDLPVLSPAKESNETTSDLPSAVTTQEKKALTYFEKNNEANHIKVLNHIKNLREQGNISYEYLGGGKYAVIMLCGSKKLKMHFPADTKISDSKYSYTDRNDEEVITKETTRTKLWSKEGKKYLEQKEKEGQKILLESEFKTLIQSLYPEGSEQEQILAFMIATGFYGWMRLKDTTSNLQRAVICCRLSASRSFNSMDLDSSRCSLVHSTFIV